MYKYTHLSLSLNMYRCIHINLCADCFALPTGLSLMVTQELEARTSERDRLKMMVELDEEERNNPRKKTKNKGAGLKKALT